ncbi:MAG: HEAT repeat domain-containing protein [Elusimicrobiota bacterium]|jgi:hypothetical protein
MTRTIVVLAVAVVGWGVTGGWAAELENAWSAGVAGFRAPFPVFRVSASFGSDRTLIEMLRRGDSPAQRAAAAGALVSYVIHSYDARSALVDCLQDSREEDSVRREAAKTLSYASNDSAVREALRDTAGSNRESEDLRSICLKSMYRMTNTEAKGLLDVLDDSHESAAVRGAAAWGLFKAANQVDVRRGLESCASDRREDAPLRAECLKSLFGQAHTVEIRNLFLKTAQDRREESLLRSIATLALINRTNEYEVRRILEGMASSDQDGEVRLAAVKALSRVVDEYVAGIFHLDQVGPVTPRNPLLYE